jgi:hypothetical protein
MSLVIGILIGAAVTFVACAAWFVKAWWPK